MKNESTGLDYPKANRNWLFCSVAAPVSNQKGHIPQREISTDGQMVNSTYSDSKL
jgi:hypothetical protein